MSTSPLGNRRLRLLVVATLVTLPLLAACDNTRPLVALNGGGPPDGGPTGGAGGAAFDGGTDGGDAAAPDGGGDAGAPDGGDGG